MDYLLVVERNNIHDEILNQVSRSERVLFEDGIKPSLSFSPELSQQTFNMRLSVIQRLFKINSIRLGSSYSHTGDKESPRPSCCL
jgi:hypothetical protein